MPSSVTQVMIYQVWYRGHDWFSNMLSLFYDLCLYKIVEKICTLFWRLTIYFHCCYTCNCIWNHRTFFLLFWGHCVLPDTFIVKKNITPLKWNTIFFRIVDQLNFSIYKQQCQHVCSIITRCFVLLHVLMYYKYHPIDSSISSHLIKCFRPIRFNYFYQE